MTAPSLPRLAADPSARRRFRGCLLGGAVGDALGAAVEFLDEARIVARFGADGIRDFAPAYGRLGAITDDTQLSLFTAEGMLRAHVRARESGAPLELARVMSGAYQRWLAAIGEPLRGDPPGAEPGWLASHADLRHRRSPGRTCLPALLAQRQPGEVARNDSVGCGGVMRVAPVGLYATATAGRAGGLADDELEAAFDRGVEVAALTHGHPTAQLPAGFLAALVAIVAGGGALDAGVERATSLLQRRAGHEETLARLERARALAAEQPRDSSVLRELGPGWSAHEALAVALYCALGAADFESGVRLAVNHGGDSDSTGSITGNLLGALWGFDALPPRWLAPLELRDAVDAIAEDLAAVAQWSLGDGADPVERAFYRRRYPGF